MDHHVSTPSVKKVPYSRIVLFNPKQVFEQQTIKNPLPIFNQVGYDSYYNSQNYSQNQPLRQKNHFYNSNGMMNSRTQGSPGTRLFYCIKDYANNLYSQHLMELDMNEDVPKRRREFHAIYSNLSFAQTIVKSNNSIKMQRTNVENAIANLIRENIKLSLEQYKAKSIEISNEIKRLLKTKIKYIPAASKILNYVKPNMSKRRFCKEIFPKIIVAIEELITTLSQDHVSLDATTTEYTGVVQNSKDNFTVTVSDCGSRNVTLKRGSFSPETVTLLDANDDWTPVQRNKVLPNDVEMIQRPTDTRKRKNMKNSFTNVIISSDDEILVKKKANSSEESSVTKNVYVAEDPKSSMNVDLDETINDSQNIVNTVSEAYIQYKSYAPVDQNTPLMSSPPDSPNKMLLTKEMSTNNQLQLLLLCTETTLSADSKYSLISFYSGEDMSLPQSHLSIKVTPDVIKESCQNIIPEDHRFVFELILNDSMYSQFHPHLNTLVEWAKSRKAPIIITIPTSFAENLQQGVFNTLLQEIERPFRKDASIFTNP